MPRRVPTIAGIINNDEDYEEVYRITLDCPENSSIGHFLGRSEKVTSRLY